MKRKCIYARGNHFEKGKLYPESELEIFYNNIKNKKIPYDMDMRYEFIPIREFTQDDLETGMVVRLRNGKQYMVLRNRFTRDILIGSDFEFTHLDNYDNFADTVFNNNAWDIVLVVKPTSAEQLTSMGVDNMEILWEEPKVIEMTLKEVKEKLGINNLKITN